MGVLCQFIKILSDNVLRILFKEFIASTSYCNQLKFSKLIVEKNLLITLSNLNYFFVKTSNRSSSNNFIQKNFLNRFYFLKLKSYNYYKITPNCCINLKTLNKLNLFKTSSNPLINDKKMNYNTKTRHRSIEVETDRQNVVTINLNNDLLIGTHLNVAKPIQYQTSVLQSPSNGINAISVGVTPGSRSNSSNKSITNIKIDNQILIKANQNENQLTDKLSKCHLAKRYVEGLYFPKQKKNKNKFFYCHFFL